MLFSSTIFLFAFLPLVLSLYFLLRGTRARNLWLLAASLFFYAWGELAFTGVLLASIGFNWAAALLMQRHQGHIGRRWWMVGAVAGNLALLAAFKYANFVVDNLNVGLVAGGLSPIELDPVHLPIGISFFTFQALTYVVDTYRGDAEVQRSPLRVALYISLFPQLIAGPIVRYRQIASELSARHAHRSDIAEGTRRFVVGLGKKVLIANHLAIPADAIFTLPAGEVAPAVAWLGCVCFAFQIYFDFSGYSDMAIGLGRIFGFHFPENFDRPYTAQSIREFWRRWHISLSSWFRDYVYIPLGGNRRGAGRTAANLLIVFVLCGLWHGASWTFVIWGLLHGGFLALERTAFGRSLAAAPGIVRHTYTAIVVGIAWVFFRCETLPDALAYLGAMAGFGSGEPLSLFLDARVALVLLVALLASGPLHPLASRFVERAERDPMAALARFVLLDAVALGSAMALAAGTHNPFIYFRF